MTWDFLRSRAFWSALGPFVASLCVLFEVSEAKTAAIVSVVTSFAGFWIVTITRQKATGMRSYAEIQRMLALQDAKIELLTKAAQHRAGNVDPGFGVPSGPYPPFIGTGGQSIEPPHTTTGGQP